MREQRIVGVVGSGGREAAMAKALLPDVDQVVMFPGSEGIATLDKGRIICHLDIPVSNTTRIVEAAKEAQMKLAVIGPEAPLKAGLADALRRAGIAVVGPSSLAARLETSKIWAKWFMRRHNIPTAPFRVFDDFHKAHHYLIDIADWDEDGVVLKGDGLAGGKAVVIPHDKIEAIQALEEMMQGGKFDNAGRRMVIEKRLVGREVSVRGISDGRNLKLLPAAKDYKRVWDNDQGLNGGGSGSFSPVNGVSNNPLLLEEIYENIMMRAIRGMEHERCPFQGFLYAGLMLTEGEEPGAQVLEFNVREGDPETQVSIPRIESPSLYSLLLASTQEDGLKDVEIVEADFALVNVVMMAEGYPEAVNSGDVIEGLDAFQHENAYVIHAGTKRKDDQWVTAGGRVVNVIGKGRCVRDAMDASYGGVAKIQWRGEQHRKDIAQII